MINGQRVLAVVPARLGSKRCPAKNIRDFRGKPLVQWTLEVAKESRYIDVIACSTDCPVVAAIAWKLGAIVVPRPAEIATDTAKSEDVMRHVLGLIPADIVVLLQPTSPLRIAADIDEAIEVAKPASVTIAENTWDKNGAVYAATADWLRSHDFSDMAQVMYVPMPASRSLDIDYPEQFDGPDSLPGYIS